MKVEKFLEIIGSDFYTGVPDSQLKALCDYLMDVYGIDNKHHIIAANEGNCTALAAGYHLATGKIPVVYMQNSGEGNVINPLASLLNERVYKIPVIFIIGWRGAPGIYDEPQHRYQGEITCRLLEEMGICYFIVNNDTIEQEVEACMKVFREKLEQGADVAFVIAKGALSYDNSVIYKNDNLITREEAIYYITKYSESDPIICTTGKASRELFEIRQKDSRSHKYDFLTVGSMGHCSSIALGVALNKPDTTVWCIDGDGSGLMHLGAIPVIASCCPENLIHIIINNGAHESVGGQPTVMNNLNFWEIARDCGYPYYSCVKDCEGLDRELATIRKKRCLTFIEIKCKVGARKDLGRPTTTTFENKEKFMKYLKEL